MTHATPTPNEPIAPDAFPSTRWSLVHLAGRTGDATSKRSLEHLSQSYWRPIHAYLRAWTRLGDDEVEDLTQGFFVWMLESGFVHRADPARGRFRAFVKVALKNFVTDERRRASAAKRGGGSAVQGLSDDETGEWGEGLVDPASPTPDELLDQAWRRVLVERALQRLAQELEASNRATVYAVFQDYFLSAEASLDYQAVAARHGITRADVSNYLQRAKRLYRSHLKAMVLETVQRPEDLQEEIQWLFGEDGT